MDIKTLFDLPPWDWPSDAGERIHEILVHHRASASDRVAAAELAGDLVVMNDDMARALLPIVQDPKEPEDLRAKAAISFGPVLEEASFEEFDNPDDVSITESTFRNIQDRFEKLYVDDGTPKEVRRRILEASVRAPEPWHHDAVQAAYASGDEEWVLTAVFAMRFVQGFDDSIMESLQSADPESHLEAVHAAGNWELDDAWPHIVALIEDPNTPKPLLLAAIEAAGSIRPPEARETLMELAESDDEEIAEAADEAIMMA